MFLVKLDHTMIVVNVIMFLVKIESTNDLDIDIKYLEYIDYLDREVAFLHIYHSYNLVFNDKH